MIGFLLATTESPSVGHVLENMTVGGGIAVAAVVLGVVAIATAFFRAI